MFDAEPDDKDVVHGFEDYAVGMSEVVDDSVDSFIVTALKNQTIGDRIEKFAPGFRDMPQHAQRRITMEYLKEQRANGEKRSEAEEAAKAAARAAKDAGPTIEFTKVAVINDLHAVYERV